MEMNDSAFLQIMSAQTQLLQEIIKLQHQQQDGSVAQQATPVTSPTGSFGTPMPSSVASPVTPPPVYPMAQPGTTMSVKDPTSYGTYAAPYASFGNRLGNAAQSSFRGFASNSWGLIQDYDGTQSSKESTEQYFSQQAAGVSQQAVNVLGGAINGAAGVGTFLVPGGLLPALAVGGVVGGAVGYGTNAMVSGARTALNYQSHLQKDSQMFLNAFNSTSDFGGIGFGLNDRQDISSFLAQLAPQKFMSNSDMTGILDGASTNGLLQNVQSVKDFKDKFTQIVDANKTIAVTMSQTLKQASDFMGEMQRLGISTQDMPLVASQIKTGSSFLGMSSSQGQQYFMQQSQNMTQGTAISNENVIQGLSQGAYYSDQLSRTAQTNNQNLYNYIQNTGGTGALNATFEQQNANYFGKNPGMLLGLFGSAFQQNKNGEFELNQDSLNQLLSGNQSLGQLQATSQNYLNTLSSGQKASLYQTAGESFVNGTNSDQRAQAMSKFLQSVMQQQAQQGTPINEQTAMTMMGYAQDASQANAFKGLLDERTNGNMSKYYNAYNLKQLQDSQDISQSPGFFGSIKYWWQSNVENPLFGAPGAAIANGTEQLAQGYEKYITGIDSKQLLGGGENLGTFNQQGLNQVLDQNKSVIEKKATNAQDGNLIPESMDADTFHALLSEAQQGKLDPTEIPKITQDAKGLLSSWRAHMIQSQASGDYNGVLGKVAYYGERGLLGLASWGEGLVDAHGFEADSKSNDTLSKYTKRNLDSQEKDIVTQKTDLNQQMATLFANGGMGTTDPAQLKQIEQAIQSGKTSEVSSLTGNNRDAVNLADKFSSLDQQDQSYSKDMNQFTSLTRYTTSLAQTGGQLSGLLAASKIDKDIVNQLMGGMKKKGEDIQKQIKDGTLTGSGMAQYDSDTVSKLNNIFNTLPTADLQKLATYLDGKDKNANLMNDQTGAVDVSKLQQYVMTTLHDQHVTEPNSGSSKTSTGGSTDVTATATKAAQDHQDAMYQFLTTYQNENQMLQQAIQGRPINNPSKQSSISSR